VSPLPLCTPVDERGEREATSDMADSSDLDDSVSALGTHQKPQSRQWSPGDVTDPTKRCHFCLLVDSQIVTLPQVSEQSRLSGLLATHWGFL
jgi:hypothetical protein